MRSTRLKSICLLSAGLVAAGLIAGGPILTGPAFANDDHADPFANSANNTSTGGSLFGIFGSDDTELSQFEPPSAGYQAITSRRDEALRLQNARGAGLVREPKTEEYLNEILRKLLVANGMGELAPKVYLHGDPGAQALTSPDGGIFINYGLTHALQTETEVAFLVAHELSHFLLQHHSSDWFVDTQSRMLTGMETLRMIGSSLAEKLGQDDSKLGKKMQQAVLIGSIIYDVSDNVMFSAWGREQEEEADRLGIDLMVGAGYYPYDAEGVMDIMAQQEALEKANSDKSKNLTNTRTAQATGLEQEDIGSNPFIAQMASDLGSMIGELSSDHYSAADRSDNIFEYNEKHYSEAPYGLVTATPWVADANHPLNMVARNYKSSADALELLADGELSKAERQARKGVSGLTSNHAFPRVAFQRVRRAQNQTSKAEQNLRLAQADGTTPILVYYEYIDLEYQRQDFKKILALVEKAEDVAGGELPQLLPYQVFAYRALGNQQKAFELQKSCEIDRPEMQGSCKKAAKGKYPGTPPVTPGQRGSKRVNKDKGKSGGKGGKGGRS